MASLTPTSFQVEDVPMSNVSGLQKRQKRFVLTGTAAAANDYYPLATYIPQVGAGVGTVELLVGYQSGITPANAFSLSHSAGAGSVIVGTTLTGFTLMGIVSF